MLEILILIIVILAIVIYIQNFDAINDKIEEMKKQSHEYHQKAEEEIRNYTPKHKEKQNSTKTMTVKEIAYHFNTTPININKAFKILLYAQKSSTWWIATEDGIKAGAIQRYNTKLKQKYITWSDKIIHNHKLIVTINTIKEEERAKTTSKKYTKKWTEEKNKKQEEPKRKIHKENIKKGKDYEEYVAKVYRSRGYHVTEYGQKMGKKDHGIDLIAKKEKHIVLIQCKNWNEENKWKIGHQHIKAFQTEARTFVQDKPLLRGSNLQARYTISGDFIHVSAIKHIEEMQKIGKKVDYEIMRMDTY